MVRGEWVMAAVFLWVACPAAALDYPFPQATYAGPTNSEFVIQFVGTVGEGDSGQLHLEGWRDGNRVACAGRRSADGSELVGTLREANSRYTKRTRATAFVGSSTHLGRP